MSYTSTVVFFIFCGFLSAWLSFSIAYLMLKSWVTVRRGYLIVFPIGFSLLGMGCLLLDMGYVLPTLGIPDWIQLSLATGGFAFLAGTYLLRRESTDGFRVRSALSILGFSFVFAVVTYVHLISNLPADGLFRIANLLLLGYVIYSLNRMLKSQHELSSVVLGFTFLVIEQFSLLLWAFDRSFVWSLIFAQLVRLAALVILVVFLVRAFRHV
jgi:hypothetical protein